jgi:hypothetical protein
MIGGSRNASKVRASPNLDSLSPPWSLDPARSEHGADMSARSAARLCFTLLAAPRSARVECDKDIDATIISKLEKH